MKNMLMLRAAAMVFSLGIGSADAVGDNGQSAPTPFTSIQAQQHSASAATVQTPPLFTIGGVEVRVRAPVAPSYSAEANGDPAARNVWGGRMQ
jgi:hypothetical protein